MCFTTAPPCHQVHHHILTKPGLPVFAKVHRLDPAKPAVAKAEFSAMEKAGIIRHFTSNPSLLVIVHPLRSGEILCDISTGSLRSLVLLQLCRKLFDQLHGVSHPGIRASRRLISSRLVWQGMSRDVGLWAKSCIPCQTSKISTHIHSTVPSIPVPTRRFSHVHVDIVGPLLSSQGHSYLLTMIDRTTRWPESCVNAFISTWISRFGVSAVLT